MAAIENHHLPCDMVTIRK